jgi:glycosyltransferase involved in cell wall biosynthesis
MKVLHLLSNWKWTERAEPAADLAAAQAARGAGVMFACGAASGSTPEDSVAWQAAAKGLACAELRSLRKHLNVFTVFRDAAELRALVARECPDVLHVHMPNAHLLAALACGRGGARRPRIVASCYDPDGPAGGWRSRWLFGRHTDGAVAISARAAGVLVDRYRLPRDRVIVSEPGVDVDRFQPASPGASGREAFGLESDDFVVGLVSRIRASRRLDVVLDGVARVAERCPAVRLLVVGRGREGAVEEVVEAPAGRLGIRDRVVLAGYCRGARLVAAYRCMDVLAYPMPGTDRSCRTIREALAAGVPVVGCREGYIPDLVEDGRSGRVVDLSGAAVGAALAELAMDRGRLDAMKAGALASARARFAPAVSAAAVTRLYEVVLAGGGVPGGAAP